jgi:hypothetical protein
MNIMHMYLYTEFLQLMHFYQIWLRKIHRYTKLEAQASLCSMFNEV